MPGSITIHCGPMFAGKSSVLVRMATMPETASRCAIYKPTIDTRDGADETITHDGLRAPCTAVATASDILRIERDAGHEIVCIEEGQFFGVTDLVHCVTELRRMGRAVSVSCLDMTSERMPFGGIGDLLCVADSVVKHRARCACCGGVAIYTKRLARVEGAVFVGRGESYEPRCERCWEVER